MIHEIKKRKQNQITLKWISANLKVREILLKLNENIQTIIKHKKIKNMRAFSIYLIINFLKRILEKKK